MLYFPCLKFLQNEKKDNDVQCNCDHINKLSPEFSRRFNDFGKIERLTELIKAVLIATVDSDWALTIGELLIDWSVDAMQMELCDPGSYRECRILRALDLRCNKGVVS